MTAGLLGKPHVWSVHEYGERDHGLEFFWPLERITADIVTTSVLVFTVSKGVAAALFPAVPAERLRPFRYSIAVPPANGNDRRLEFFTDNQSIKLGMFASLHPSKGQEDAILAAAELVARGRNVELLIAGSGDQTYQEKLAGLARNLNVADRIHFSGFLVDPYSAMHSCDIIIVCSRNEGFGRVAVEAMLMEKPVVYAAAGGLLESMVDGQTGLSYPPANIERLVAVLEELINNPELRGSIGRFARPYAEARFGRGAGGGEIFHSLIKLPRAAPKMLSPSLLAESMFNTIAEAVTQRSCITVARDELHAELKRQVEARDHCQADADRTRTSLEGIQARLAKIEAEFALSTGSLAERDRMISDQNAQIANLNESARERDVQLAQVRETVAEQDHMLSEKSAAFARSTEEQNAERARFTEALADRDRMISEQNAERARFTEALTDRDRMISEQNAQSARFTDALADRDRMISEQAAQIAGSAETVNLVYGSTSWRITAPVRFLGRLVRRRRQ
jgi:hypothetical protein